MESRVFINPNAPIAVSRYGEAVSECRSRYDHQESREAVATEILMKASC